MTFENSIYIDVDGTLIDKEKPNNDLIAWIKDNKDNFVFVCWSQAGQAHAQEVLDSLNISDCFRYVLAKPSIVIDDRCWSWTFETKCFRAKAPEK